MPRPQVARQPYARRAPPDKYDKGFVAVETMNIQRAIPVAKVRQVTFTSVPDLMRVLPDDDTIIVDATGGAITIVVPPPENVQYLRIAIKRMNAGANAVTVDATIDGTNPVMLNSQYSCIEIQSTGSEWILLGSM